MATIYTHFDDESDFYLSLDSMTHNGYFPLTISKDSAFVTTQYDDLSEVTRTVSEMLSDVVGMSRDNIIKAMEEVLEFFNHDEELVVWAEDMSVPPYVLNLKEDYED